MLFKKSTIGWIVFIALSLSPILPWLFLVQPISQRFINLHYILQSIGQLLGLVGVSMFSLSLVLSIRPKFLEHFFGGMNRVYVAHHIFGGTALILLLIHPLSLAASLMPYSLKSAALYLLPGDDWSINIGISALLLMMSLLILTFFVSLPYQVWRLTHKFLGAAFFLASIHGFFVSSDISGHILMKLYMFLFFSLGLFCFTYKTLLGKYFIKKYTYTVSEVKELQDKVIEISLLPEKTKMNYSSGQFVFISFKGTGVTNEVHPFSISSASTDTSVRLTIKAEGDYTATLHNIKPGDKALIEGSFGEFLYDKIKNTKQVWVAGGIGITPFLSMARSIKPEYVVDLFYSVRTEQEAVYLSDLLQIATINKNFRVFPCYSKAQGRLTADTIAHVSGDITQKDIFICGPPPMMKGLRTQLKALHVLNTQIHTEEFNLL